MPGMLLPNCVTLGKPLALSGHYAHQLEYPLPHRVKANQRDPCFNSILNVKFKGSP